MSDSLAIARRLGIKRGRVEPRAGEVTPEEARNGWDAQTLARYVNEREIAASQTILNRKPLPVMRQNSRYQVFKWRRR